jgi:peptide chain release factor 1
MSKKFTQYLSRQQELEDKFAEDPAAYQEFGKEYAFLNKICPLIKEYEQAFQLITDCELMLETEKDMYDDLISEIKIARAKIISSEEEIKQLLFSKDNDDDSNAILEIRPGTGGVEACLFAYELMRMYARYAQLQGWEVEEKAVIMGEQEGLKEACLLIKGENVYKFLKYESGVHRVQRVPATEAAGRIHTSAATVAVLPEEKIIQIKIDEKELEIDVYRAGGKGGQSVNTTDSAVRITHKPTGIVVAMQDERSQLQNKVKAMNVLKMRLYEKYTYDEEQARSQERKEQVGSGDRSEKIRTYNYPQDRCTDHRVGQSWFNLPEILSGRLLKNVIEAVCVEMEKQKLAQKCNLEG